MFVPDSTFVAFRAQCTFQSALEWFKAPSVLSFTRIKEHIGNSILKPLIKSGVVYAFKLTQECPTLM